MILPSTYILTTDNTTIPFTLVEVNDHLKEGFTDLATELYLVVLMQAVKQFGEEFTWRTFLNKVFTVYLRQWPRTCEIRRSKLISIASVKYIDVDGATQTVDAADYGITVSDEFASLYFKESFSYPSLNTDDPQPIFIELTAGYGIAETDLPRDIKLAMLQHLANLWKHRGDCPSTSKNSMAAFIERHLPPESELIYNMNRIIDISM